MMKTGKSCISALLTAVALLAASPGLGLAEAVEAKAGSRADIAAIITRDFLTFDPDYHENRAARERRLDGLKARLFEVQAGGNALACSDQIFIEAKWLLHYTADWPRLDRRLDDLAKSLQVEDQDFALRQSAEDGAWGACYEEWFHKLDATIDGLNELIEQDRQADYPFSFLDPIASPEALTAYLDGILVSDIARTGRNNRNELGAVTAVLSQILFKRRLRESVVAHVEHLEISETYIEAYRAYLDRWQDRETGYWGAWYRSQGGVHKSIDLSLTYHTVAYRHGKVRHLPRIVDTTLAIKDKAYPHGWLHRGDYNNHNSYDVVRILEYGWPVMSAAQRTAARAEIEAMLDWAVAESLRPDGSVVVDLTFYNRVSDAYYYTVSFFDKAGYWDPTKRFWTDVTFPEAAEACQAIKRKLEALALSGESAEAALQKLDRC